MRFITSKLEEEITSRIDTFKSSADCKNVGLVLDDRKTIFRHGSDFVGSAASLIKLLYGAAFFQYAMDNGKRPDDIHIPVDPNLFSGSLGSFLSAEAGMLSAYELMYNMIVYSCNDSANHLVNFLGMDFINQFARKMDFGDSRANGLFKRHPEFGAGSIIDGPYCGNTMSADDAHTLVKMVFHNVMYDSSHPDYHKVDPHRNFRFLLEQAHGGKYPHPLVNFSKGGGIRHNLHPETLDRLVIGQKYGISFFDYGVAGYVYPIEKGGISQAYFISILINGFGEPLKDHKGIGTKYMDATSQFVSSLSKRIYLAFFDAYHKDLQKNKIHAVLPA